MTGFLPSLKGLSIEYVVILPRTGVRGYYTGVPDGTANCQLPTVQLLTVLPSCFAAASAPLQGYGPSAETGDRR
jgi:hypothetical protein